MYFIKLHADQYSENYMYISMTAGCMYACAGVSFHRRLLTAYDALIPCNALTASQYKRNNSIVFDMFQTNHGIHVGKNFI